MLASHWRVARLGWIACATALATAVAFAQEPGGVRLDWEADPKCGASSAFVDQVHARSPRVRIDPDSPRTLIVRIGREAHGAKMSGRIELREPDGTTTQRSVSGASCEEVISALGLVTAVALDPLGVAGGSTADAGTAMNAGTGTGTGAATATATATAAATATATATAPDEANLPVEKRKWSFAAGVDAEVVAGVTPDPVLGVPVFLEATRALSDRFAIGGGLRFERAGQEATLAGDTGADFTWTAGAADFCGIFRASRFRLDGCARGHFGAVDARGEGVVPPRSATRPWADLGLGLSLRLRVAGPVFVEAQGYGGFVLVQDRFFLEPSTTVFQAPLVTGHAGGGVGFEIW